MDLASETEYVVSYTLGNAACIFIMGIILYRSSFGVNLPTSFSSLKRLIGVLIGVFIEDSAWVWIQAYPESVTPTINYIATTINVILITIAGYQWFCFCKGMVHEDAILRGQHRWRVQVPIILTCFGFTLYYGTGFDLAHMEEFNFLNVSYCLLLGVPIVYVMYASWRCFRYALHHYEERTLYMSFALFAIAPTIASMLQVVFWTVPMMCYAMTSSVVFTYLLLLESLISKDTLTQLANRNEMMNFLARKLENPLPDRMLFFFMMDLDDFKGINDTFGHMEGDRALRVLADALRVAESRWKPGYSFFPARFGGDEFLVIGECQSEPEVLGAKVAIRSALASLVAQHDLPYDIQVSIGAAVVPHGQTIALPHLMELADKALYQEKRARKVKRGSRLINH